MGVLVMEVLSVSGFGSEYVWVIGDFVDGLSGWVVSGCVGLFVDGVLVEVYGLGGVGLDSVREFLLNVPEGGVVGDEFVEFLRGACFYCWGCFGSSSSFTKGYKMV